MQWTGLNELREKYLEFFESKGHLRLPSFSLIPQGDKSLLLIPAGMAPMKKYFTGELTPPCKRVTTCQKCIRTPDIERVGKTARHGTYFEMLGNFSFGDYFKKEVIPWAWEFCTKVLELPTDRLWVSIYLDDDEAYNLWVQQPGMDPTHIVRLGKEDNFWEHGEGPCGPCSEIHFDRGEEYGCGSPTCGVGCDCDRYVEFWNLVFTQFDSDGKGHYTPLAKPNIDTGMGLERLACIMQGVNNLFEVDTVRNIMQHVSRIAGVTYGEDPKKDVSLRVITDHIRSTTFLVGDGVMPSNEGRGYVLRRLLRRAARHGRLLGIHRPFLYEVCDTVIQENLSAYPELKAKEEFIKKLIRNEEESFEKTIDSGLQLLDDCLASLKARYPVGRGCVPSVRHLRLPAGSDAGYSGGKGPEGGRGGLHRAHEGAAGAGPRRAQGCGCGCLEKRGGHCRKAAGREIRRIRDDGGDRQGHLDHLQQSAGRVRFGRGRGRRGARCDAVLRRERRSGG